MTTTSLHQKRVNRTSLKKADQYRKEAAFFKQRNQALVGDIRRSGNEIKSLSTDKELLGKNENELRIRVSDLESRIIWLESFWLTRIVLWFKGVKKFEQ